MSVPGAGYDPIVGTNTWGAPDNEYLKLITLNNSAKRDFADIQAQVDAIGSVGGNAVIGAYPIAASGVDTYTGTFAGLTYFTGLFINLYNITNNTGSATLNINGLGAVEIKVRNSDGTFSDPQPDELRDEIQLLYDGTRFVVVSSLSLLNQRKYVNSLPINIKDAPYNAIGDKTTDDTSAIQSAINDAIAESRPLYIPEGEFKTTSKLFFASENVAIFGVGANKSVIYAESTDLIEITQTSILATLRISGLTLSTNLNGVHKGIIYNGATASGATAQRLIDHCTFIGEDYRLQTGTYNNSWGKTFELDQANNFTIDRCFLRGAEEDRIGGVFPNDNYGIEVNDSTHFYFQNCLMQVIKTGLLVTGACENFYSIGNNIVACNKGIKFTSTTSPVNDHNIVNTHIASYEANIELYSEVTDITGSISNNIKGCLLFKRADSTKDFKFIYGYTGGCIISNTYFYYNGTFNANDIGIQLKGGESNVITDNIFFKVPTLVKYDGSDVITPVFVNNQTIDDANTLAVNPIDDGGAINPVYALNYGDRAFDMINSPKEVVIDGNVVKIKNLGGLVLETGNVANAVNNFKMFGGAAGIGPQLQVVGDDADIDLRLVPKGNGKVRFGARIATSDSPVTGYIEVKASDGTTYKLAIID